MNLLNFLGWIRLDCLQKKFSKLFQKTARTVNYLINVYSFITFLNEAYLLDDSIVIFGVYCWMCAAELFKLLSIHSSILNRKICLQCIHHD